MDSCSKNSKGLLLKSCRTFVVFISVFLSMLSFQTAFATSPGYANDTDIGYSNPDWMSALPDNVTVSQLSLPGTHDTMSHSQNVFLTDFVKTQSMDLDTQLDSGIRVLDIRARQTNDVFEIHHGDVYLNANFTNVMDKVNSFLGSNPTEVVFMRLKKEGEGDNNDLTFVEVLENYMSTSGHKVWQGSTHNPTLSQVRGKIVIFDSFPGSSDYAYIQYPGGSLGSNNHMETQDGTSFGGVSHIYDKWVLAKTHFNDAASGNDDKIYYNHLSGYQNDWIPYPYYIASGHSSPGTNAPHEIEIIAGAGGELSYPDFERTCILLICSVIHEGTNTLSMNYINSNNFSRVGMVMADFPGGGLIDAVINVNDFSGNSGDTTITAFKTWNSASDIHLVATDTCSSANNLYRLPISAENETEKFTLLLAAYLGDFSANLNYNCVGGSPEINGVRTTQGQVLEGANIIPLMHRMR